MSDTATTEAQLIDALHDVDIRRAFLEGCSLSERALREFPDSPTLIAIRAHYLAWLNRRDDALRMLESASSTHPESSQIIAVLAELAAIEGNTDESVDLARRALALNDTDRWTLLVCADAFTSAKDHDASAKLIERICGLFPDDPSVAVTKVRDLQLHGRTREADTALAEAEARFPDYAGLWAIRAAHLALAGKATQSIELYRKTLAAMPEWHTSWAMLSSVLRNVRRYDEAEQAALEALRICPCAVTAMSSLAALCSAKGDEAGARKWREKAAEAVPALRHAGPTALATAAMRKGDWSSVLSITDPLMAEHLQPMILANIVALRLRALVNLGRLSEADDALRHLRELTPDNGRVFELGGLIELARGNTDAAIEQFREGTRRSSLDGACNSELLHALHSAGRVEEQGVLVAELRDAPPDNPAALAAVITAMKETGYAAAAEQLLETGLERFPESDELRMIRAIDKLERGDFAGAQADVANMSAEWRPIAKRLTAGASRVQSLQALVQRMSANPNALWVRALKPFMRWWLKRGKGEGPRTTD